MTKQKIKELADTHGHDLYMQKKVIRWNGRLTITSQNIAEHHATVTQLVILILEELNVPEEFHLPAIKHAAVHDIPEVFTNDISYEVKVKYPEFKKAYDKLEEDVVKNLPKAFRDSAVEKSSIPWIVVKIADSLDVYLYTSLEIKLGNKNEDIVKIFNESLERVNAFVDKLSKALKEYKGV